MQGKTINFPQWVEWENVENGVFIWDTYCADDEDLIEKLRNYDPEDMPTEAIVARKINWDFPERLRNSIEHLYDDAGSEVFEEFSGKKIKDLIEKCEELADWIDAQNEFYWFEPCVFSSNDSQRSAMVKIPESLIDEARNP